ncbi:hypothetical protein D3C71_1635210 [compost metagenome]
MPSPFGRRRAVAPSVGITPGAMALKRMPWRPHSIARDLVMASMPALDIADGTTKGVPVQIQVTTMDTTAPGRPEAIQRLPTAWVV